MREIQIEIAPGELCAVGPWSQSGNWWLRRVMFLDHDLRIQIQTIGYQVFDDGAPMQHDTHAEAREWEEQQIAGKVLGIAIDCGRAIR